MISCQIESWFLDIAACIWVEGGALIDHMCFLMASELQWQQEHQCTEPEVIVHPPTDPSKWYRFGCPGFRGLYKLTSMQVQSILSCSLSSCIWLCLHGRRLKLDCTCDCIHITFDLNSSFRSCRVLYCKRSYIDADTSGKLKKLSSYSAQLRLLCSQLSSDQYVYCMTFSIRPAT